MNQEKEPICIASRGRYTNGKDGETEQHLEFNATGVSNALTTAQKDCYIGEPVTTRGKDISSTIRATYYKQGERNLMKNISEGQGYEGVIEPSYRIRKLTPVECWKFMGFKKEDYLKAKDIGVADGNLYKQAGNGIVTNCVQLIFEHLYKALYDNTYTCTDENFTTPQTE